MLLKKRNIGSKQIRSSLVLVIDVVFVDARTKMGCGIMYTAVALSSSECRLSLVTSCPGTTSYVTRNQLIETGMKVKHAG